MKRKDPPALDERARIRVLVAIDDAACRARWMEAVRAEGCVVVRVDSAAGLAAALLAAQMGMLDAPDVVAVGGRTLNQEVRLAIDGLRQSGDRPVVVAVVSAREPIDATLLLYAHARVLQEPFDPADVRALVSRLAASPLSGRGPATTGRAQLDSVL